jgi:hypothetical protein
MFNSFSQSMVSAYEFVVEVDACRDNRYHTNCFDFESVLIYIEKCHLRMIYHQILLLQNSIALRGIHF